MAFTHPEWSFNSNIYEVNVRQYTVEGTFQALSKHLPRLKEMHVEVLWFMPLTPISVKDRKGSLGSYYAVKNYCEINHEYGSMQDFIELVKYAHELGFKVIIDWVANHTGNDHNWIEEHPEYYSVDQNGHIQHPNDWSDVSHLNFAVEETRTAMISSMAFWIQRCNIDGFRCDMAHLVPLDFWLRARLELDLLRPGLLWLAECEEAEYHQAFDITYTWEWMHASEQLYQRSLAFSEIPKLLQKNETRFPTDALRAYFTNNHDENSWNGTEYEKFREMALPLAVFSCTWNGLPLIYSGQELPNYKRLKFFDKDVIEWEEEIKLHDFYKKLLSLRKRNPALMAGSKSRTEWLFPVTDELKYFAFCRSNNENLVLVYINFSAEVLKIPAGVDGFFQNVFDAEKTHFSKDSLLPLNAWEYLVFEKMIS